MPVLNRIAEFGRADHAVGRHCEIAGGNARTQGRADRNAKRGIGLWPAKAFAKHHPEREDLADRIGDILARDIARGAMAGLVDGMAQIVEIARI